MKNIFLAFLFLVGFQSFSQKESNVRVDGILYVPKTQSQRLAIVNLRIGLTCYQSDGVQGLYTYTANGWVYSGGGSSSDIITTGDARYTQKGNNLSDLSSASTARTNLGLGSLATQSGTFSGSSTGSNSGDNATNSQYSGLATSKENAITGGTTSQYFRGDKTFQNLDKTAVGLGNVDNTSDVNKPISNSVQSGLNLKANINSPSFTGMPTSTTATSGTSTTQIATTEFVSNAITNTAVADATTVIKGKIQLAGDLGGTANSPTVPGLLTKENSITAGTTSQYFRGDKSFQTLDKSVIGLSNVDNVSDANKTISTATQTALNSKLNTSVLADSSTAIRNAINTKASITLANSKLHNAISKSALIAFTDANFANYDGSIWERKSGNVASNGGSYAGTIINVSSSFYWERKFQFPDTRFFGVVADNSTDNSATLQAYFNFCIANNYEAVLPKGIILYNSQIVINATNGCNIRGQGREQTKLRYNSCPNGTSGIKIIGAFNDGAYNISDLLIGNEGTQTGTGIEFNSCQNINLKNVVIFHYELGMKLIDVNASNFENLKIHYCIIGLKGDMNTITPPNALKFSNCYFNSNSTKGILLNYLHSVSFDNCLFEDNGTQGVTGAGAFEGQFAPINGLNGVTFNSCYFEHNGGEYDVKIQVNAGGVSSINNCTFNRVDPAKYTISNILLVSEPASTSQFVNTLKMSGNGFFTANGYVSTQVRRSIAFASNAAYKGFNIVEHNNVFSNPLDAFIIPNEYQQESYNTKLLASLRMGGDASIGHSYNIASVSRDGPGNYLITFANPLPHYPIISVMPVGGVGIAYIFSESLTNFRILVLNLSGTNTDLGLSIAVH
jgi:hypothetical protein